jgi:ABC-type amino acid transport substrate-binding protein
MEGRKQAVSIRLSAADVRNLRKLSRRLGARNSDVIRYALKTTLARLAPLHEGDLKGRDLLPVLADTGADLMRYLDIEACELEALINEGAPPELQVHRSDIQLLAMTSLQQRYARFSLVSNSVPAHEDSGAAVSMPLQSGARS